MSASGPSAVQNHCLTKSEALHRAGHHVDFDKWGEYLPDGALAMAFLDRFVEGAIILKIKGKSYRAPKATAENNPP